MAWFRMLYSKNAFERSLRGRAVESLSPAEGLRAMAAFYRDHRPQHAPAEEGDDVLEVRWGPAAGSFELSIARRMHRHATTEPERVLELGFRFRMTPLREAVSSGQHALDDPTRTQQFLRRVTASAPWKVASGAAVTQRSLTEA